MGKYVKVAETTDLPPGRAIMVHVGEEHIGLFNVQGTYYAIGNMCTHVGAPLHEGMVQDTRVVCPLHHAEFDLTTGRALTPPAPMDVPVYRVRVVGTSIEVEVPGG